MATVRHIDSIGRLCIALAHRWEPQRLFVILIAYFDEIGTHARGPTVILSAYVGRAYQWRRYETKLARIQKKYGFTLFHAEDFWGSQGEFKGWSVEKKTAFMRDMIDLMNSIGFNRLSFALKHKQYKEKYRSGLFPKTMRGESQYSVCFREFIGELVQYLDENGNRDQLNIVMVGAYKHFDDCNRIFHDLKRGLEKSGQTNLGTFTTAGKDCMPLMAASVLATRG